uniref:Uncharacterized protein n=1 Tax=Oryza sativa subsp. japonica TaxID=39947 RepID=Q6YZF9_ORYSJ|nr:hypothetical protein [Oryza sativa Japonica Group]BAD13162.1 hypothetical protein [Oryza sativa Japonica Group]
MPAIRRPSCHRAPHPQRHILSSLANGSSTAPSPASSHYRRVNPAGLPPLPHPAQLPATAQSGGYAPGGPTSATSS